MASRAHAISCCSPALPVKRESLALALDLTPNQQDEEDKALALGPSDRKATLQLRPGIVLFDPEDHEIMRGSNRRGTFHLQLDAAGHDNQTDHEQNDDEDDKSEDHEERMRNRVIEEICVTEKNYVRDIRTLHDHYIVPLEDNKHPIMDDAQIAVFFNNVRQLVMLNSKLLNDLQEIVNQRTPEREPKPDFSQSTGSRPRKQSYPQVTPRRCPSPGTTSKSIAPASYGSIGAMFCRYAPLFKLYAGYAKDYEEVARLLQSYAADSRLGFTAFLEKCRARSGSDTLFESFLIMPIQRIPRYKLLLERVVEYTPQNHPDQLFLTEAVNRVSFAASLINETVRHQENLETVLKTQTQFAGQLSLFTSDRRLIKAGKLIKMSTKRREEVMLHLFNDLLLYSGVLITGGYRVRRVVYLHSKAVGVKRRVPSSYGSLFESRSLREDCGFVITSLEKTFILFASTPDEQTVWVDSIENAIRDAQKNASYSTGEGPADAAALWVPDAVVGSCTICHSAFKVYFRRHHCRRCGAVVCGNCSDKKSILFVADCAREERVCDPCFVILDLVKKIAFRWLARVVEFKGILRRKRWHKWTEHYFELKAGMLKQYTVASANGTSVKACTDMLTLAGAIVIHRSDSRAQKNRYCFQISTSDAFDSNPVEDDSCSESSNTSNLMYKLSPLKNAVSRFGDAVLSRESGVQNDAHFNGSSKNFNDMNEWILCANSYEDELAWSSAIQRSADRALNRVRRSRVTEYAFPVSLDRSNGSVPVSPTKLRCSSDMDYFTDEAKQEHRRLQILKEILRSEESYVTCLGECIRLFVQPLLLRQLEGQTLFRRRQSKKRNSLLHPFGGGSSSNLALSASAFSERSLNNSSIQSVKTVRKYTGAPNGLMSMSTPSDSRPRNATSQLHKVLVLDADMAIFFSSVDQICTLNQQLLEHLSRHMDDTMAGKDDSESVHRAVSLVVLLR